MSDSIKLEVLRIPRSERLDPIAIYFEDHDPGVGRVTIACYGDAWTAAWGQMGNRTVREFVASVDSGYLSGSLLQLCGASRSHREYTARIAEAVIAASQQPPTDSLRQVPEDVVAVKRNTLERAITAFPVLRTMLGREGLAGADIADDFLAELREALAKATPAQALGECLSAIAPMIGKKQFTVTKYDDGTSALEGDNDYMVAVCMCLDLVIRHGQHFAGLAADAERIASCPWRVQKGCTSMCQPPNSMRDALARAQAAEARCAEIEQQLAAAREALKSQERDARAWRNRFIDERMRTYEDKGYEMARCYAESDANDFIEAFHATLQRDRQP